MSQAEHSNEAMMELVPTDFSEYHKGALADKTSLVLFYASWCGHCKNYLASPVPAELKRLLDASKRSDLMIAKFEGSTIPEHQKIASEMFKITAFPTIVLIHVDDDPSSNIKVFLPEVSHTSAQEEFNALTQFADKIKKISNENSVSNEMSDKQR